MDSVVRIVLVDDHQMIREALRFLIEREPGYAVVGEAGDGRDVQGVVRATVPHIVCMDIDLPGVNGVELTRQLAADNPDLKVIALSAMTDHHYVIDMVSAGAVGYITKTEASGELVRAIKAVGRKRVYLSPEVAGALTANLSLRGDERAHINRLGPRELAVLRLVARGYTSIQIAKELNIAPSTADAHRRNVMRKLDLHGIAELTRYAIRNGLLSV